MRKISTRIKRILTSNLGLKIVSVLVACMMWIFVVNVDDPEKVQSFSDVKVEIRNSDCDARQCSAIYTGMYQQCAHQGKLGV